MQLLSRIPTIRYLSVVALLGGALAFAACDSGGSGMDEPEDSLAEVVSSNSNLSTLASALQAADLAETLGDEDATFTVFAPANSAFENVDVESLTNNPELLRDLLTYHVVQGEALTASDLEGRESVTTVEGQELEIGSQNGTLTVGGIPVSQANVEASNGVAHVIGGVLVPESFPQRRSYDLEAQSNNGAIPDGVNGTVTFWEYNDSQTLVTLSLDDGPTGTEVSHPAHIHNGEAGSGGDIQFYLTPLDGTNRNDANDGTSARLVNESFETLADFNGYVNIHESVANPVNIVSQGNIGANATGTFGAGLQVVDNPSSTTYSLAANSNEGAFPEGVPGQVQFLELTTEMTLATVRLDPDDDGQFGDGPTQGSLSEATVSHPGHIHNGAAGSGGGIAIYLSPVDGSDPAARSSQIIRRSLSNLTGFDGYVNVHESAGSLGNVVSQGNIGANAGNGGGGSGSAADVTVTIENVGSSAWEVANVDGASGVAGSGENPTLTLEVGTRYRFDNNGGSAHPLGLQNANDEYLLNQDGSGSLEGESGINYEEDSEGITFTYTQSLADALNNYRCTVHASMEGGVDSSGSGSSGGGY